MPRERGGTRHRVPGQDPLRHSMLLKTYSPLPKFPPVSLSGTTCQLNCRHCSRSYLRAMAPAVGDTELVDICQGLHDRGAVGVLLSGGSARDGTILNLRERIDAIRQVKAETGLILNIHPGLMDQATAEALAPVIDFVSLEIPSTTTIRDIFGLDASTEDYIATYHRLRKVGMHVAPHIAIYNGTEDRLLDPLAAAPHPETIVIIVFSPTRNTPMAEAVPPTPEMVGTVIERVKARFPATEIALGCMRPRARDLRTEIEVAALDAGATRIELPSRQARAIAQAQGYEIVRLEACCALPVALENRVPRHSDGPNARMLASGADVAVSLPT